MRFFYLLLLLASTIHSTAQFAFIDDKDGYVNVREQTAVTSKLLDTLHNNHFVYCLSAEGNWQNIDYQKGSNEKSGFIYKDRCRFISSFTNIPIAKQTKSEVILKKDSIEIIVSTKPFDKKAHRFSYHKEAPEYIRLIDQQRFWGTDGGMPTTEYKSVSLKIGKQTMLLPKQALQQLYEPGLESVQVHVDPATETIYIELMNGDGAGSYEFIWRVRKGKYIDRYIASGF